MPRSGPGLINCYSVEYPNFLKEQFLHIVYICMCIRKKECNKGPVKNVAYNADFSFFFLVEQCRFFFALHPHPKALAQEGPSQHFSPTTGPSASLGVITDDRRVASRVAMHIGDYMGPHCVVAGGVRGSGGMWLGPTPRHRP